MPAPTSTTELLGLLRKSGVVPAEALDRFLADRPDLSQDPIRAAGLLVQAKVLTTFQAKLLLAGRYKGFRLGSYLLRDQLGQGGMGAVYLAEHETLRRLAAIKVLPPGGNKLAVERFLREARAAAALDHPNIVRTHDVGRHGEVHFLVMEYVEGQTLEQLLTAGGPVSVQRSVDFIAQASTGLQHAYEKGFIHRDIKPSNLILTKDGTVKILDMGLARSFETSDQLTELLDQGAVVGTADFISPEQAMNDPKIDIRTDIYSLGATFYSLVTGRPPFDGPTASKLIQHQMKAAPSLTILDKTIPKELAAVVGRMMAKKPADRYQTPADVIVALHPWLHDAAPLMAGLSQTREANTGKLSSKHLALGAQRLPAPRKKPMWIWASAGCVAILVVLGLGVAFALSGRGDNGGHTEVDSTRPTTALNTPTTTPMIAPQIEPPPPGPPPEGKVLFAFDAASVGDFRSVLERTRVVEGKLPNFPKGLGPISYKEGSRAQFVREEVRGKPGIAMTNLNAGDDLNSAQFGFQLETDLGAALKPGTSYILALDYATTGSGKGSVSLQSLAFKNQADKLLPGTGGDWKTVTVPFRRAVDLPLRFVVDAYASGQGNALVIGKVVVREDAAAPTGPVGPTKTGESLDKLSWEGVKPFKSRTRIDPANAGKRVAEAIPGSGDGTYPPGWLLWHWNAGTVAEAAVDESQGGWAIGIRNAEGPPSAMIFPPAFVSESGHCRIRCEVLYTGKKFGAHLKMIPDGQKSIEVIAIEPQAGWQTIDLVVDCRTTGSTKFEFHNWAEADQWLWIRSYEVFAVAKDQPKK